MTKRYLSMLLAVVMVFTLFIGVSASAKDAKDFTDLSSVKYTTAVDILARLDILKGQTDTEFAPTATLTRAEGATLIARILLGHDPLNGASDFTDVASNAWPSGAVQYAKDNGIINGVGNGKFDPNGTLTVMQYAKLLLGAIGYGKIDKFVGASWENNVYVKALELGTFGHVGAVSEDRPITREEAAEMTLRTLLEPTVQYLAGLGGYTNRRYSAVIGIQTNDQNPLNATLGEKNFGLVTDIYEELDQLGRPLRGYYIKGDLYTTVDASEEYSVVSVVIGGQANGQVVQQALVGATFTKSEHYVTTFNGAATRSINVGTDARPEYINEIDYIFGQTQAGLANYRGVKLTAYIDKLYRQDTYRVGFDGREVDKIVAELEYYAEVSAIQERTKTATVVVYNYLNQGKPANQTVVTAVTATEAAKYGTFAHTKQVTLVPNDDGLLAVGDVLAVIPNYAQPDTNWKTATTNTPEIGAPLLKVEKAKTVLLTGMRVGTLPENEAPIFTSKYYWTTAQGNVYQSSAGIGKNTWTAGTTAAPAPGATNPSTTKYTDKNLILQDTSYYPNGQFPNTIWADSNGSVLLGVGQPAAYIKKFGILLSDPIADQIESYITGDGFLSPRTHNAVSGEYVIIGSDGTVYYTDKLASATDPKRGDLVVIDGYNLSGFAEVIGSFGVWQRDTSIKGVLDPESYGYSIILDNRYVNTVASPIIVVEGATKSGSTVTFDPTAGESFVNESTGKLLWSINDLVNLKRAGYALTVTAGARDGTSQAALHVIYVKVSLSTAETAKTAVVDSVIADLEKTTPTIVTGGALDVAKLTDLVKASYTITDTANGLEITKAPNTDVNLPTLADVFSIVEKVDADAKLSGTKISFKAGGKDWTIDFTATSLKVTLKFTDKSAAGPATTKTAAEIVTGLTVSLVTSSDANTKVFDMADAAAAKAITDELDAIGYSEDASGQGADTIQPTNTYSTFDLAAAGWGTTVTLYVYIP